MKELQPNLIKIARVLSNCAYHSGDELGQALAITRSAIWKAIKKLQQYGIEINSVKSKGYALTEPLLLLDKPHIIKQLKLADDFPLDIKIFASLDSTNHYLQNHPEPRHKIKMCLAETQTCGRGRLNRQWHSPFGKNIYFSCRYRFQKEFSELAGLSLVAGLATLNALREFSGDRDLMMQWPNHVVWKQKKIAGSLIEISAEANGECTAIIGIGINVNMQTTNAGFPWVSMQQVLGKPLDRNAVCATLINHLLPYLRQFEQQNFAAFKAEWVANDCLVNQAVAINQNKEITQGQVIGVNNQGHLMLKTKDGHTQIFTTGDCTLLEDALKVTMRDRA